TGRYIQGVTAGVSFSGTQNSTDYVLRTNNTNRARLSAAGNFNVGTDTTPDSLFTVGSTSQFQVNSSGRVLADAGASGAGNLSYSFVGDTDTGIYLPATDTIALQT